MIRTAARHVLGVGLEPLDAARGGRLPFRFRVALEATARGLERPAFARHPSGVQVLLDYPGLERPAELRAFDDTEPLYAVGRDRRRFVPRRVSVPLAANWSDPATDGRARRLHLFPGAAYDLTGGVTALRGRVTRGGEPVRWARVEARALSGTPVGFAHGDDRGEFLLVLGPLPTPTAALTLWVVVWGRPAPLPPTGDDPLWDVPQEALAAPGAADPVAAGRVIPGGYIQLAAPTVTFTPGRTATREFVV